MIKEYRGFKISRLAEMYYGELNNKDHKSVYIFNNNTVMSWNDYLEKEAVKKAIDAVQVTQAEFFI